MDLYVCINSLAIIGFLGVYLHSFMPLVDPLKMQQGWVTPLREGSQVLRVTADWHPDRILPWYSALVVSNC